jgi:hypothetical protein
MTMSEQLSRLTARTKELEERAAAGRTKALSELEDDVQAARDESRAKAAALRESVDNSAAEVSAWWTDMGQAWDKHVTRMREHLDTQKAAHDLKAAERDVEEANAYASCLIDYTYAAVEEAEYAVLDATLAKLQYDQLAAKQSS